MLEIERSQQNATRLAFSLGLIILGLKFAAFYMTDSAALLSDALESIINVVASAFAMWSIHVAKAPPDKNHPYGHGKIEYFSALIEGVLIVAAAICIMATSIPKIYSPGDISQLDRGLMVSVLASAMNLLLGIYLVKLGKRTRSLTLIADGKHILTDVYTTAGVVVGLLIVWATHWLWIDGAIACIVAVNIVWMGYLLIRQAVKGLMNETDTTLNSDICKILNTNKSSEWISIHKLRTWQAGRFVHFDFHVVLPRSLSFEEANMAVIGLENIFRESFCSTCEYDKCICSSCRLGTSTFEEIALCSD